MATEVTLDRFQRWMQAVIVHPGTDEEALASEEAQAEISADEALQFALPSRTLTPIERMGIYRQMYVLRLCEALEIDYPVLRHFLGDEVFTDLACGYIEAYPSRNYSLNPMGDYLPEYIQSVANLPRRGFSYDLARLELALNQVFHAPKSPALTAEAIAAVPVEAWERARLKPIEAFQLLSFRYPVNEYLQSVRDETPYPKTRRKDSWVAVYRRDYIIWRLELTGSAHDLLQALVCGRPLGEAITAAVSRSKRPGAALQNQFFEWFREWVSEGIFQAIDLTTEFS